MVTHMDRGEITRRVRDFVSNELILFDSGELNDDTPLLGDLIDSVGLLELVSFLEGEFYVTIGQDDFLDRRNFQSVAAIAQFVEALRERRGVESS
jgi:acyl carrier protein